MEKMIQEEKEIFDSLCENYEKVIKEKENNKRIAEFYKNLAIKKGFEIINNCFKSRNEEDNEYFRIVTNIINKMVKLFGATIVDMIEENNIVDENTNTTLRGYIAYHYFNQSHLPNEDKRYYSDPMLKLCDENDQQKLYEYFLEHLRENNPYTYRISARNLKPETFKRIVDKLGVNNDNVYHLIVFAIEYLPGDCARYVVEKSNSDFSKNILEALKTKFRYNDIDIDKKIIDCLDIMEVSQECQSEYETLKRIVYINTFEKSYKSDKYDNRFSDNQINTFCALYANDLKGLKEYMIKMLHNLVLYYIRTQNEEYKEYIRSISDSYVFFYISNTENNQLTDFEVIDELYKRVYELIEIERIRFTSVLDEKSDYYNKHTMYERVYEDENVQIYYLEGINGLYVEERSPKLDNKRYYLFPIINEDGKTIIKEVAGLSPQEFLDKTTTTEKVTIGGNEFIKYHPIDCQPEGWDGAPFTSQCFINLTGDETLSDEEAFKKTCEIIESCPELKQLIKVDKKVYKKESNN